MQNTLDIQKPSSGKLVIKGQSKVDAIRTSDARSVLTILRSWHCSRLLRRDFNHLTTKMFYACFNSAQRERVHEHLAQITKEAENLWLATALLDPSEDTHSAMTVRLLTNEAQILYDAILCADASLAKLLHLGAPEVATERGRAFFAKFQNLKSIMFQSEQQGTYVKKANTPLPV